MNTQKKSKLNRKILVSSLVILSSIIINNNITKANELDEIKNENPVYETRSVGTQPSIADGAGGGHAIYVKETRIGAPWVVPDYIDVSRYINGKYYSGRIYYSRSTPIPSLGVELPAHMIIATYEGYIY